MNITAIYGSPRKAGNTDLLLQSFIRGIKESGGDVREIFLRDLTFDPCIECSGCNDTGTCVLSDDMDTVYPQLITSEVVALAAPVFFYGLNALAKAMVDRSQCFWAGKYLLNDPASKKRGSKGKGILLSVGGSKGKKNFDCIVLTMRYFFDAIDMDFAHHLTYGGIDAPGAIAEHPTALNDAYMLGVEIMKAR